MKPCEQAFHIPSPSLVLQWAAILVRIFFLTNFTSGGEALSMHMGTERPWLTAIAIACLSIPSGPPI